MAVHHSTEEHQFHDLHVAAVGVDEAEPDGEAPDDAPMDDGGIESIQQRLPGGGDWKARFGAAGTREDERRNSPIVELSLLLVGCFSRLHWLMPITIKTAWDQTLLSTTYITFLLQLPLQGQTVSAMIEG